METVWVVEEGSYSDYRVVGVFSSKENAERVAALVEESSVSEWPLDPGIEDLNQGRIPYRVMMERDGTIKGIREFGWDYAFDPYFKPSIEKPLSHPKGILGGVIFATDEQHAIKIMNEIRAQMIANGEWPEER